MGDISEEEDDREIERLESDKESDAKIVKEKEKGAPKVELWDAYVSIMPLVLIHY